MKKLLTLFVCSLLAIGSMSAKDIASGTFRNGGTWKISDQGELYIDAVTIPDYKYSYNNNELYYTQPWYAYGERITSIHLSSSVQTIGEYAFARLWYASTLTIDSHSQANVVIKQNAFERMSKLKSVDLTDVKAIEKEAFFNCNSLSQVILGDALQSIGDSAFYFCRKLFEEGSYIQLPNSNVFASNWWNIVPDRQYVERSDGLYQKEFTAHAPVTYLASLNAYYRYTWAKTVDYQLVCGEIGYWLFSGGCLYIYRDQDYANPSDRPWHSIAANISSAEIYTTTIGKNTFNGCTSLHFVNSTGVEAHLDNITSIGENAFYGCTQLQMVDMPRIQSIGNSAFENSGVTLVRFNSIFKNKNHAQGFKNIGANAFKNTPLHDVFVYGDCPQTQSSAFISLTSANTILNVPPFYSTQYEAAPWNSFTMNVMVDFPVKFGYNSWAWELRADGTLTIMGSANNLQWSSFRDTPWYPYRNYIRKIVVGEGIKGIGDNAFAFTNEGESNITNVTIPASVQTVGENAFKNNDQIEVVEAEGVKSIGSQAFENCSALEKVKFGKDVTSLGNKVFNNCGIVDVMAVKAATPPTVTAQTFQGLGVVSSNAPAKVKAKAAARGAKAATGQKTVTLEVPDAHIAKYLAAQYWNLFSFEYIGEHGGIVESDQAYDGVYVLYSDGTMIVSASAPTNPQDINVGFTISSNAKSKVKRVEIQGTLEKLGHQFRDCPNLEEVVLSGGITSLNGTFYNCPKLKTINLDNVTALKSHSAYAAFQNCTALTEVNLPNAAEIGDNCFKGCTALKTVTLGGNCEIGEQAFANCTALQSIDLGAANLNGALQAFQGCTALKRMSYQGTRMPAEIFKGCTALRSINLGGQLKDILSEAFANTAIDTIYVQCPTPPEAATNAFSGLTPSSIRVYVPAAFDDPYWSAPVWEDMFFYDDEDYDELDFPIHFAIGSNGWGVVDDQGSLTINAMGALDANVRDYVEPYAPYINNEIRIGNDVTSLPAGSAFKLPFGWVKENTVRYIVLGSGLQELGDYALYNNVWDCDLIVDCYALNPPTMQGAHVFNWSKVQNGSQCVATLNVVDDPTVEAAYRADTYWKKFSIGATLAPADAPTECTVTFVDWDGTVLQQTTTRPGMMVTPPADPVRDGYTFKGWDSQDYNWVVSDLTITALYYDDTFTVRFYDWDGTMLSEQTVNYGQAATAPADPSREGYTFLGWSEDFSDVTADKYIVAMYHNDHEGIEDIQTDMPKAVKIMAGDQILILRDGKVYTVTGTRVQ